MTNDYKERIIKWLTGNYTIEPSSTEPLFQELNQTTTTINTYVDVVLGYIQGKDGKGNDLEEGFIYGLDSNDKGIIIVVDNNFNVLQVIDEFDSGTTFREFICLNIDSTNGNIYGIDKTGSQYRFILLNNFLVKTPTQTVYEVKLRNSYNLSFVNSGFTPKFVEKKQIESFYVITGIINNKPMVATYKIEVGSTNELEEYTYTDSTSYNLKSYNIEWSGDTYIEKIGCYYTTTDQYNFLQIKYVEFSFDGSTITKTHTVDMVETYLTESMLNGFMSIVMTNDDTYICYPLHGASYDEAYATPIYKINYTNNTYTEFTRIETEDGLDYNYSRGKLVKNKNDIYFYLFANTTSPSDNTQAEFKVRFGAILYSNNVPYITAKEYNNLTLFNLLMYTTVFNVSNIYNLYTYNLIGSNSNVLLNTQQILNSLNYNYEDYQDLYSMVPNSVWLYSNNKIVYARNLYNKLLNGNVTISTVEVPNMMLNDITITPQVLLGKTNGILINNSENIEKNVYEDLFINFYNTLTMQNQNTALFIPNLNGATRLNNSISNTVDYNNAKIGKIRLNYSDNTTYIKEISSATRISQFVYRFSFNVYVPNSKTITSVELLSSDEETSYQTINTSNLVSGKSYKISQDVEIGG